MTETDATRVVDAVTHYHAPADATGRAQEFQPSEALLQGNGALAANTGH